MITDQVRPAAAGQDVATFGSFIDGRLDVDGDGWIEVVDPATSQLIGRITEAGAAGVDRAVEAGRRAFPAWRATPARDRGALVGSWRPGSRPTPTGSRSSTRSTAATPSRPCAPTSPRACA